MQKRRLILVIGALFPLLCGVGFMTAHTAAQSDNDGYKLVFSDEFNLPDGSQPDPEKWVRSKRNPSTWARWISPSSSVVYIKNGSLICRAIPNKVERSDTARMLTGAVESLGKFDFQYGKVLVRMKTNLRQGNFPAVWLRPSDIKGDSRYGEIDIVEMYGYEGAAHHTIHTHQSYTLKTRPFTEFMEPLAVNRWHVYGMEWTPDSIMWTVDDVVTGVYHRSADGRDIAEGQWTFDRHFYLRLNQSLGDASHGRFAPLLNKSYETRFDWIRVYQRKP